MAEEEKPAELSPSHVLIKVIGQDKSEIFCRIKRSMQLKVLMNMYCERRSVEPDTYVFLLDGKGLRGDQTPQQVGMEDGDSIDAMLHQSGGAVIVL